MSNSPSPQPVSGTSSSDTVNFSRETTGIAYDAGAGNDYITGSKGNDVIRGGAGADRIQGGAGNDTYVFVAGDLVNSLGQNNGQNGSVDHIVDFQGAGSNTGSGYQDQLAFYGYGAGTKLVFDHYAADRVQQEDGTYKLIENQKLQYYKVVDASDHSRDGYILVQMQDGTSQLTASDYIFNADAITGTSTGDVTEAGGLNNADPGTPTFNGKLTATTFDQATSFKAVDPSALAGKYGSFAFASDGTWSYTLDNTKAATEALKAGDTQNETLVVQTLDGTMKTLTVHVHGADDIVPNTPATIGGTDTGTVKEDDTLSAMGHLTISDPDAGQGTFVPHTGNEALVGTYGSLTIDAAGAWTYNLDNAKAQPLKEGETVHDVITVASVDGTTHNIDVTIDGTNDAPTGMATAVLAPGTEDMNYVVSKAALLAGFSDIDGDTLDVTNLQAGHDSIAFVITRSTDGGPTTYTIQPDPDYNGPVMLNYTVSDGHGGTVAAHQSFTLAPVNDAPVANPDNVTIRESDAQYRGNVLNNDFDVDGDSLTASLTPGGTHHGSMVFNSDGSYVYTLNTSDPAVNGLSDGERLTDTYTYTAFDDHGATAQSTLTINIQGVPDAKSPVAFGFENGFGTWQTIGQASIVSGNATEGTHSVALTSSGASADAIEQFLGLSAGKLSQIGGGNAVNGSAIKNVFHVDAGQKVSFDFQFEAGDVNITEFNDFAFVEDPNGNASKLASISSVGDFGSTGWQKHSFIAQTSGDYTIGMGVANVGDGNGPSLLYVDHFTIV